MSARVEDKSYIDAIDERSREAFELSTKNASDVAGLVESTRALAASITGLSSTVYGDDDAPGMKGRLALAEHSIAGCLEASRHPREDRRLWVIWGALRDIALPVALSVCTTLLLVKFT